MKYIDAFLDKLPDTTLGILVFGFIFLVFTILFHLRGKEIEKHKIKMFQECSDEKMIEMSKQLNKNPTKELILKFDDCRVWLKERQ